MSEHEDVEFHIAEAQALLQFVDPQTPSEKLIAAQTHALLGFLLEVRNKPAPDTASIGTPETPQEIRVKWPTAIPWPGDEYLVNVMSTAADRVGGTHWSEKMIHMIKEVRAQTRLGLKETKDLVDASKEFYRMTGMDWWDK